MPENLYGRAYAKINLFLDVTGMLDNGYHSIATVMQSITLYDSLKIEISDAEQTVIHAVCDNPAIPDSDKNIAFRAARLFLEAIGKSACVNIEIKKNIPLAAGLAGGSTDAACVLRLLNRYYGNPLTYAELSCLASKLGSDVPFCLNGGTQKALGRGEILTPLRNIPECFIVAAIADESVSTPWAYNRLDGIYNRFENYAPSKNFKMIQAAVQAGDTTGINAYMYNIFEEAILPEYKGAAQIKSTLLDSGAEAAMLSGSGPSVFGIFQSPDKANKAINKLNKIGMRAYFAKPVNPQEEE